MPLKKLTPELIVENVKKSIEFYHKHLNFDLVDKVEVGENYSWALLKNDSGIEIMLISKEAAKSDVVGFTDDFSENKVIILFETEQIGELYDRIRNCKLAKEKTNTSYGTTEFAIRDLDGNILMFTKRN